MWKLVLLVQCATLILSGLGQGAPLRPEEMWKSLDNPRNRDLFFRTLNAYFSGRGLNFKKVPDPFMVNDDKPGPIVFLSDPVASSFAHYEKKKNSITNDLNGGENLNEVNEMNPLLDLYPHNGPLNIKFHVLVQINYKADFLRIHWKYLWKI